MRLILSKAVLFSGLLAFGLAAVTVDSSKKKSYARQIAEQDPADCDDVSTLKNYCGTSGTSHYSEYDDGIYKWIAISGIPSHDAENDAEEPNPNTRCD